MRQKADLLILNADELVTVSGASSRPKKGKALDDLGIIRNGALAVKDGEILAVGESRILSRRFGGSPSKVINATGKTVLPGFIDPHTHLVFAGSRHREYSQKITGLTYEEIVDRGIGAGIPYTVKKTREASRSELLKKGLKDLDTMLKHGTTTVEIKSGYGLDVEREIKILKTVRELSRSHPIGIVPTFLAHYFPENAKKTKASRADYVNLLKTAMAAVKKRKLAEYCDVFCDQLAFSVAEARDILMEAKNLGFKLKLHAEQTSRLGGAALAAELKAVSADHLDYIDEKGIRMMAGATVIGVLLPTVTFHLMEMIPNPRRRWAISKPFLPRSVQKMIDGGVPVALATDYNPGTSPTPSMQIAIQCAARLYRMSPAQIINAATINAAHAIGRASEIGSLEAGKKADVIICDCPSYEILVTTFGVNLVDKVIKGGRPIV